MATHYNRRRLLQHSHTSHQRPLPMLPGPGNPRPQRGCLRCEPSSHSYVMTGDVGHSARMRSVSISTTFDSSRPAGRVDDPASVFPQKSESLEVCVDGRFCPRDSILFFSLSLLAPVTSKPCVRLRDVCMTT